MPSPNSRPFRPLGRHLAVGLAAIFTASFACSRAGMRAGAPSCARLERLSQLPAQTEEYAKIEENPFLAAWNDPVSTFSIDVDTASYANVRRYLNDGRLPPPDAVRLEELVNYFRYDLPVPEGSAPIGARLEIGPCPWAAGHRLLRIGLAARPMPPREPPPVRNLVFLIDVSGSMDMENKLPLVKRSLGLLAEHLTERDRVSLVVYAGAAGMVLPPTPGNARERILAAIDELQAGGSTNGGAGIVLAYDIAQRTFVPGGVNRVVLATDGDFNVGVSSQGELIRLVEQRRDQGVFLTVLGFGMGNLKDATMERLADRGNGNYAYIDSFAEARKALVEDAAGTLITVAKDVKVQIEMNPAKVARYRLLGYENRMLRRQEFDDDRTDAGDMGAGQTVTAFYEIEPAHDRAGGPAPLRYLEPSSLSAAAAGGELATLKVRYNSPYGRDSEFATWVVHDDGRALAQTSRDFRFAAAVAAFGLSLRASPHRGTSTFELALRLARSAGAESVDAHRREFLSLATKALALGRPEERGAERGAD